MTGQELQPVDQDIVIDEVTIEISKGRLRLFGAVSMNGHKAAEATITISTDGVCIIGTVDDITIGEDVVIKEASINIVIGSCSAEVSTGNTLEKGKGVAEKPIETPVKVPSTGAEKPESGGPLAKPETPTRTAAGLIKGIVKIKDITFLVALAAVKVDGKMEWVVYGEMNSKTLSIGELIGSGPDDEILNVALRRVTIVASSVDDPKIPELNVCGYPIKQGNHL